MKPGGHNPVEPDRGQAPAAAAAPAAPAGAVLDEDVPCEGCGYNLRGLAAGGHCPECGRPVGRSLAAKQAAVGAAAIPTADRARLVRGSGLLIAAALVSAATGLGPTYNPFEDAPPEGAVVVILSWGAAMFPFAAGWWGAVLIAIAHHPARSRGAWLAGRIAQWAVLVGATVAGLGPPLAYWAYSVRMGLGPLSLHHMMLGASLCSAAATAALCCHAARITREAGRRWLARQFVTLALLLPAAVLWACFTENARFYGMGLVCGHFAPFPVVGTGYPIALGWVRYHSPPTIAAAAAALWAALYLTRLRRAFKLRAEASPPDAAPAGNGGRTPTSSGQESPAPPRP